ncbi:bombesin receptor subtype-3-like [Amphiura filiformis]|uniref:bombesin receptor subtype-3-like n=1 Tax=Amphiura filiformis TaxID=82378 RepID=UPI003B22262A
MSLNTSNCENVTSDDSRSDYEYWSTILLGVFTFIGTVGNVGLLLVVVSTKHLRTVANIMVVNLTVGDLLYLLISTPFHIEHDIHPSWQFGAIVCKLSQSGQVAAQGVCVLSLFAVSLERHQAITKPRVRSSEHNMLKTLAIVGVIWLVSVMFSTPIMILADTQVPGCDPICVYLPHFTPVAKAYTMSQFLALYVLPLAAISCFYVNMARVLLQSENNFKHENQPGARQFMARRRLAIIVLVITVLFGLLWLPYYAYNIWFQFNNFETALNDPVELERIYHMVFLFQQFHFFMGVGNSCVNPWVVFFMSSTHRRELINAILCRRSKTHDKRKYQPVRTTTPKSGETNHHNHDNTEQHELSQTLL